jgi:hypothetical protein
MTDAGGLTIGGLLVLVTWGGFRAILWASDVLVAEICRSLDIGCSWVCERAAYDDAAHDDAHGLLLASPAGLEPETILLASGNSLSFTGERSDA